MSIKCPFCGNTGFIPESTLQYGDILDDVWLNQCGTCEQYSVYDKGDQRLCTTDEVQFLVDAIGT